jgi:hypothetical protein
LRDLSINGRFLPEDLLRRARHGERERPRPGESMRAAARRPGESVVCFHASHESLARRLRGQLAGLDLRVELALLAGGRRGCADDGRRFRRLHGEPGARRRVKDFRQQVIEHYRAHRPPGEMYVCRAVDGLRV